MSKKSPLFPEAKIKKYRLKYFIYRHDRWIFSILLVLLLLCFGIVIIDQFGLFSKGGKALFSFTASLSLVAFPLTLYFGFIRQRNSDMNIFFDQFEKFNYRYDKLNNKLQGISEFLYDLEKDEIIKPVDEECISEYERESFLKDLKLKLHHASSQNNRYQDKRQSYTMLDMTSSLQDYFNLCAEQYFCYKRGYIPPKVFKDWVRGMNHYFKSAVVRDYLFYEISDTDSYYSIQKFIDDSYQNRLKKIQELENEI